MTLQQSIKVSDIPDWHLRNAQRWYADKKLALRPKYRGGKFVSWSIQGMRPTADGAFWGCLEVDLAEACDMPHTTRKRWEQLYQQDMGRTI
jgi:hypothetical protein